MGRHFLTREEIESIRDKLEEYRAPGSYVAGKWDVSHYNREREVLGKDFPDRVIVRDITLRVIEQAYGVSVTPEERIRIAVALDEAGVSQIQLSLSASNPYWQGAPTWTVEHQIKAMHDLDLEAELTVEGLLSVEEVARCADAGVDIVQVFFPAIPPLSHILHWGAYNAAWKGEDWRKSAPPNTVEGQIEEAEKLIGLAKQKRVQISIGVNVLAYSTPEYLRQFFTAVSEAGVEYVALYDGSGGMGPEAWRYVVSVVKEAAPSCKLAVHAHNTFGLATANTLAGVQAGADVVEVSVNGIGSLTTGQAPIAEVVAALTILYGTETGVRMDKLVELSRLVEDVSRLKMLKSTPVTGEVAFAYNTEIVVQEQEVDPLLHFSVNPEVFGNRKVLYIGKGSGYWTLQGKLEDLGVGVNRSLIPPILEEIKAEMHVRKRVLTDTEIANIAMAQKGLGEDQVVGA